MIIPPVILDRLQAQSGLNLMTANDQELSAFLDQVLTTTGYPIGLTTFKRMIGKIADHAHQPRHSMLDAFARYLGMASWDELLLSVQRGDSSFEPVEGEVRSADLPVGGRVELSYLPDRQLQFQKVAADEYEVILSVNSKLCVGDRCRITSFVLRYPLIIADVVRHGQSLGSYSAARSGGIKQLAVQRQPR